MFELNDSNKYKIENIKIYLEPPSNFKFSGIILNKI